MKGTKRVFESEYMQWAKERSQARFNLATSGVPNLPASELPFSATDLELTGSDAYGYLPLLEAIAAKCGVAPENVVTAAGTSMANHLALAALVEPGDDVLVEQPVYEPLLATARYLGAEVRFFPRRPEHDYRVDPDEVERLIRPRTRLVALTNLHNPSSALEGHDALARVGTAAARAGAWVLVDEVYLDAVFEETPRSAFHLGPNFVATNSLTKIYGVSGLRCGWVLADARTARRMWLLNDLFGVNAAHPAERLSEIAFGRLDELRERARAMLDANRRLLYAFYDARDDLEAPRFPWGTTSFPRLLRGSATELCAVLRERYETAVVPGAFFGSKEHFRIGLACDPGVFAAGLERLAAALDEVGGSAYAP
jgi:aspartate/methionine/tyrosine aminotransferase